MLPLGTRTRILRGCFNKYLLPVTDVTTGLWKKRPSSVRIVMEWGDAGGEPFVVSGQAWGEENLAGRPAILDMPVGKGHVVSFNFNPMHRDLNRGDQRLLWNALLNWQAILASHGSVAASSTPAPEPDE